MLIKILIVAAFIAIITSLGSALFHIVKHKDDEDSKKTARALTVRIGVSLGVFILLFIAFATGLIQPHGIGTRMHGAPTTSTNPSAP
ncbi:twin transmembrane helix small protein [Methylomonas sp. SURF-1]|uniref:Twin transmembrane helix small protein n=1 Tax=Methylomonas aurea TaxID=2952224 RepID=A0ABT1UHK7_9GAMM|nr:twin transmembrane helix small protein [Methylomonas sp. SURF-1]MCQ8181175.1 twin transmembrane helix small protein [Methylomonas sp. SURF-1]